VLAKNNLTTIRRQPGSEHGNWLFIDSKWCYFNEVSDGVLGAFVQDADNTPGSI